MLTSIRSLAAATLMTSSVLATSPAFAQDATTPASREDIRIVVGSHGRHGLALLLGSTASGVLHGAKCDVLAVRI